MSLQFQTRSKFLDLHLSTGLIDWDMDEEIKLTTTTDQFYHADDKRSDQYLVHWHYARISRRKDEYFCHSNPKSESLVQPNLWLMVNPKLACPIKYTKKAAKPPSPTKQPTMEQAALPQTLIPAIQHNPSQSVFHASMEACLEESRHEAPSSSEFMLTDEDEGSSVDVPSYQKVKAGRKAKAPKARLKNLSVVQNKRVQRSLQDTKNLKLGAWPRPPVNYCILIAMAISSSRLGSLNVQQIYNFTREHFPFFQTAPDGWKNTIRHNLCFSNSFSKTPQQVCSEGKRKSCLWHLTIDGRQRLRDEILTLSEDSFRVLKRSMNHPSKIR
ncbi:forkhead box protein R1 [Aplochiton taeniatus]